jgi:hypothetical protein
MYTINDLEKILNFKTWSDKRKIDELLMIDARIYASLGSDSTKLEVDDAKRKSKKIYRAIKEVDHEMGNSFLELMDK